MKRIFLVCLAGLLALEVLGIFWTPVFSSPLLDELPEPHLVPPLQQEEEHGWRVCAIGDILPIPGVGNRQKVELCHNNGWRVDSYCLNPGMPVPQLSAYCSQTSPGVFWCGNGVQMLQQYAVLATPGPQPSRTPTRAPTATATATNTFTATPGANQTTQPQLGNTPIPVTATPYYRPQAGGPGNIEAGAALLAGFAMFAGSGWWLFRHIRGLRHG